MTGDEFDRQLAHVDVEQLECEARAAKDAAVRAVHDVVYYSTLRANGIGPVTACLLVCTRAATDIV